MKYLSLFPVVICVAVAHLLILSPTPVRAHCQVPCGIYGDDIRFQLLLEHAATIEKAMRQIAELSGSDAQLRQQVVRWVANKEKHADEIQTIVQQYFLAQRVKVPADGADDKAYLVKLKHLHHIIVHAMKCKQTVDVKNVTALKQSIAAFKKAYSG